MTVYQRLIVVSAMGLAVLLTGCSLGQKAAAPERNSPAAPELKAELEQLRKDNADLKQQQAQLAQKLSEMDQEMNKRAQEQRRFQEMMATNFDMLEQSVSMTLAQDPAAKGPRGKPSPTPTAAPQPQTARATSVPEGQPPRQTATADIAPATRVPGTAGTPAPATRVPGTAGTPAPAGSAKAAASAPRAPAPVVAARAEAQAQQSSIQDDPDLRPPAKPLKLEAHPAAKPLYDKGFAAFARRDYNTAVQLFTDFLERYPTDNYSDNAQFWIAESYFYQGRWAEAEAAYRRVLRNYEHRSTLEGYKTPDAIYRIGQTYLQRHDADRAAYYFGNVAERFADSTAGMKAQKEMSTIAETAQAKR